MSLVLTLCGLLLGGVLLALTLQHIDGASTLQVLQQLLWTPLLFAQLAMLTTYAVKAHRWCLLLQPVKNLHWRQLYNPVCVGAAGNGLLSHSGEILRTALLQRRLQLPYSATLTSIAVERLFDFIAIALLTVAVLPTSPGEAIHGALLFIGMAVAVLLLPFITLLLWPPRCRQIAGWVLRWLPDQTGTRLIEALDTALAALAVLRQHRHLPAVIGWSLVQWLLIGLAVYLCIAAIGVQVSPATTVGVLLLTVAGLTLPTAPGYVGTLQACFIVGLAGVALPADAFAASLLYNLTVTLLPLLISLPTLVGLPRTVLWRKSH